VNTLFLGKLLRPMDGKLFEEEIMTDRSDSPVSTAERAIVLVVFLALGTLIMLIFSPWRPALDRRYDYLGRLVLIAVLFLASQSARNRPQLQKYWLVLFGLFTLITASSLDYISGIYLIKQVGITDATPAGWAIQKMNEFVMVVGTVLILNRLAGLDLKSLYIQRGNLRLGLIIGLSTFLLAMAGSIPMATLFNAQNLTAARILPWVPWILIYVLANAAMEEILFRGVFLKKLAPFVGKFTANLLVATVFTLIHGFTSYSADNLIFVTILFPLALAWGWTMQRTEAVWGSILFHAGMDIPIMLGIFSNL
jgi:membrane protease YdiL (CAAX protease family)